MHVLETIKLNRYVPAEVTGTVVLVQNFRYWYRDWYIIINNIIINNINDLYDITMSVKSAWNTSGSPVCLVFKGNAPDTVLFKPFYIGYISIVWFLAIYLASLFDFLG